MTTQRYTSQSALTVPTDASLDILLEEWVSTGGNDDCDDGSAFESGNLFGLVANSTEHTVALCGLREGAATFEPLISSSQGRAAINSPFDIGGRGARGAPRVAPCQTDVLGVLPPDTGSFSIPRTISSPTTAAHRQAPLEAAPTAAETSQAVRSGWPLGDSPPGRPWASLDASLPNSISTHGPPAAAAAKPCTGAFWGPSSSFSAADLHDPPAPAGAPAGAAATTTNRAPLLRRRISTPVDRAKRALLASAGEMSWYSQPQPSWGGSQQEASTAGRDGAGCGLKWRAGAAGWDVPAAPAQAWRAVLPPLRPECTFDWGLLLPPAEGDESGPLGPTTSMPDFKERMARICQEAWSSAPARKVPASVTALGPWQSPSHFATASAVQAAVSMRRSDVMTAYHHHRHQGQAAQALDRFAAHSPPPPPPPSQGIAVAGAIGGAPVFWPPTCHYPVLLPGAPPPPQLAPLHSQAAAAVGVGIDIFYPLGEHQQQHQQRQQHHQHHQHQHDHQHQHQRQQHHYDHRPRLQLASHGAQHYSAAATAEPLRDPSLEQAPQVPQQHQQHPAYGVAAAGTSLAAAVSSRQGWDGGSETSGQAAPTTLLMTMAKLAAARSAAGLPATGTAPEYNSGAASKKRRQRDEQLLHAAQADGVSQQRAEQMVTMTMMLTCSGEGELSLLGCSGRVRG